MSVYSTERWNLSKSFKCSYAATIYAIEYLNYIEISCARLYLRSFLHTNRYPWIPARYSPMDFISDSCDSRFLLIPYSGRVVRYQGLISSGIYNVSELTTRRYHNSFQDKLLTPRLKRHTLVPNSSSGQSKIFLVSTGNVSYKFLSSTNPYPYRRSMFDLVPYDQVIS